MTIDRRSFLRALGITPAAIVAAKYIPEAEAAPAPVPQYEPSPELLRDGYVIPRDAVVLRIDETDYHALSIEMASHSDSIGVTRFYDSTREYLVRVPDRREVVIKCAGIHQLEKYFDSEKVACSIFLRNGAQLDFAAYVMELDNVYDSYRCGNDFTRLRLSVHGDVTLRRC